MNNMSQKLLLVDDNLSNLRVYERILEDLNIVIVKALSGEEALDLALEETFFLILMDVQMPGMDGFETASFLINHPKTKHTPIIFITAIAKDESLVLKGYERGAIDYITKPINEVILRNKVEVFLKLHEQQQALIESEKNIDHSLRILEMLFV